MDKNTLTVWLDVTLLMLGSWILMAVLMMAVLNPPARGQAQQEAPPPGNMTVEIEWPMGLDVDVDLWVKAPGDHPVGYSNKSAAIFNLLRDDLGRAQDLTESNYEVAYTRGLPVGEYVINVHAYRNAAGNWPVPVKVKVTIKKDATEYAVPFMKNVRLNKQNQEITVFRFKIDENGRMVSGSMNDIYKPLRVP